jgi:hypothetical protein
MIRTAARVSAEFAGFAILLFVTRFVMRSHLIPLMDQECHIGGIAIDVLAHGIRFPLLAYAPNEYDNGSFFSGLLTAASFALLGRSVLALKLVTHLISAAGAVAALWLLRGCLDELGVGSRRARWAATAALIVAIAFAPRVVTLCSTYGVGNHAEGSAIDVLLLALFSRLVRTRSSIRTAAFWALVGFALYLNKGTLLVIPVLGVAEIARSWHARPRLLAALGGLLVGVVPELLVIAQRNAAGWSVMSAKPKPQGFPAAFLSDIATLGEHRIAMLAVWAASIVAGTAFFARVVGQRSRRAAPRDGSTPRWVDAPPVNLGMVLGFTCLHVAALTVMAQGGPDAYAIYSFPTLAVLTALLVAWTCARAEERWGDRGAALTAVAAIASILLLYRPDALAWRPAVVAALWRNTEAAACSWRFAEGFEREQRYGLAPAGTTREQHAIDRCRSLSEHDQVLDCIGGIARELHWREGGRVKGEPPAALNAAERRAYAYDYGTHRMGKAEECSDFGSPELVADCVAAVQLECLVFADAVTRFASGHGIPRPLCDLPSPPMNGYWASMRRELLARPPGAHPDLPLHLGDTDLQACESVLSTCYPP